MCRSNRLIHWATYSLHWLKSRSTYTIRKVVVNVPNEGEPLVRSYLYFAWENSTLRLKCVQLWLRSAKVPRHNPVVWRTERETSSRWLRRQKQTKLHSDGWDAPKKQKTESVAKRNILCLKKGCIHILARTLSNLNVFSKFFYCCKHNWPDLKTCMLTPTTP